MSSVRKLVGAAAVAALCLAAVGCTTEQGAPRQPDPSGSTTEAAPATEQTLQFVVHGPPAQVEAYADLARAFTKNNPHITVEVESADDPTHAMAELDERFEQGQAPDVFLIEHEHLPALMQADRVRPVNDLLEARQLDFGDGFQRDGLEAFSAESALQCMPHDVSPLVVYYNQDLLPLDQLVEEGEEPPAAEDGWTWEQFAAAAQQASRGRTKGLYVEPNLREIAPFLWSAGGELVDDLEQPTTLALSSEQNRETLEQVLALLRDPQVTPTPTQLGRRGAVAMFTEGRLAMMLGTRALTPQLRRAPGLDFEVFPLPTLGRFRTIASLTGYCISAETDKVEAAADFLAFAVSREGATITTLPGYVVPSNLQVQYSPAFIQPGQQPDNSFVFTEGVRRTNPMPLVAEWPRVLEETEPFLERMFYAPVIELETLLEQIDTRSRRILPPPEEPGEEIDAE